MNKFESYYPDGRVYLIDDSGEHEFPTREEYEAYQKEKHKNDPILCDTCISHIQKNKRCYFGEEYEGRCTGCTYYYPNPESLKEKFEYFKFVTKNKIRYYWSEVFCKKLRIGRYASRRKFWFVMPSRKYPYFMFVYKPFNEYENPCVVYRFGYVKKDHSFSNKNMLFEKHVMDYDVFYGNDLNYDKADCIEDYTVNIVNGLKNRSTRFKCRKGVRYSARYVPKYKYYDLIYSVDTEDDSVYINGQIPEDDFKKHFDYKTFNDLYSVETEDNKQ